MGEDTNSDQSPGSSAEESSDSDSNENSFVTVSGHIVTNSKPSNSNGDKSEGGSNE